MDEIYEREDEEKRVGSKLWIITQKALTKEQIPNPAMQEFLKKRKLFSVPCTNWVCAGTFLDHKWVSESTISQYEEEVMGIELDNKIGITCVVQRSLLWFSAPTRLNRILGHELKIKKVPQNCRRSNCRSNFTTIWR